MLEDARKLLEQEYKKSLSAVKDSAYYTAYAEEKLHHSLQVSGAGNYIIKHEDFFRQRAPEFIETAKTAVLLHDIARFDEITARFLRGEKIDHGVAGYEKLSAISKYSHILVALPIKHHGHVKEAFYNDDEYKNITDKTLADDCNAIYCLIRDADKIANFNIVCTETEKYLPLFIPSSDEVLSKENILTSAVVDDFLKQKTVDYSLRRTRADYFLTFISWFFDLNYRASVVFCRRLNLLPKMFKLLERYHNDRELDACLQYAVEKSLAEKFG